MADHLPIAFGKRLAIAHDECVALDIANNVANNVAINKPYDLTDDVSFAINKRLASALP